MYKYDLKGHYYKIIDIDNDILKEISEKEYLEKSGDKLTNVNNLKKSLYPEQINDYILLKTNKGLIPIDYQLSNIIKLFWKKGIHTKGIDKSGHIDIETKDLLKIKKIFDDDNIKVFDIRGIKFKDNVKNYRKRIKIIIYDEFIRIFFKPSSLQWIHNKLNIKKPKYKDALKGNKVITNNQLKFFNIVK